MSLQLDPGRSALGSRASAEPSWLSGVAAGRDFERLELRRLAAEIARRRSSWQFLVRHDTRQRTYVQLHRDAHLDVWLLCWAGDQETGLHDHDLSSGAVHVCEGDLVEDRIELRDGVLQRASVTRAAGATFDFDSSHVHCLRHAEGSPPAVSIHVYSPALWRMGYYDFDGNGLLRRVSVSYAEELSLA